MNDNGTENNNPSAVDGSWATDRQTSARRQRESNATENAKTKHAASQSSSTAGQVSLRALAVAVAAATAASAGGNGSGDYDVHGKQHQNTIANAEPAGADNPTKSSESKSSKGNTARTITAQELLVGHISPRKRNNSNNSSSNPSNHATANAEKTGDAASSLTAEERNKWLNRRPATVNTSTNNSSSSSSSGGGGGSGKSDALRPGRFGGGGLATGSGSGDGEDPWDDCALMALSRSENRPQLGGIKPRGKEAKPHAQETPLQKDAGSNPTGADGNATNDKTAAAQSGVRASVVAMPPLLSPAFLRTLTQPRP